MSLQTCDLGHNTPLSSSDPPWDALLGVALATLGLSVWHTISQLHLLQHPLWGDVMPWLVLCMHASLSLSLSSKISKIIKVLPTKKMLQSKANQASIRTDFFLSPCLPRRRHGHPRVHNSKYTATPPPYALHSSGDG